MSVCGYLWSRYMPLFSSFWLPLLQWNVDEMPFYTTAIRLLMSCCTQRVPGSEISPGVSKDYRSYLPFPTQILPHRVLLLNQGYLLVPLPFLDLLLAR